VVALHLAIICIMWFTENPWPPIFICTLASAAFLAVWYARQQRKYLTAAIVCVVAAVTIYLIEQAIVTDAERIEQNVTDLVAAFQRKDGDRVASCFSVQAPALLGVVLTAMNMADVHQVGVKDMGVQMVAGNSQGIATFRANGTVSVPSFSI